MNWLFYLLEANLYLLVFFAFYLVFLRNETFYILNRYYLLLSSALSFVLPFLKIGALSPAVVQNYSDYGAYEQIEKSTITEDWIAIAYIVITTLGLLKLIWSASRIIHLTDDKRVRKLMGLRIVVSDTKPFSFFNYLFINPYSPGLKTILRHEKVHIQQLHSADIAFFELLKIVSWFNPVIIFLQQEIKTIHEFLADREACKETLALDEYAMFLIQNSNIRLERALINQMFNQSLLKKRIIMLSKKKSPPVARIKYGLMIMIVPAMVCGTSIAFSKNYGYDLAGSSVIQDSVKSIKNKKVPPPPPAEPAATRTLRAIPDKKLGVPPPPPPERPTKHQKIDPQYKGGEVKFPAPKVSNQKDNNASNKSLPRPKVKNIKFPPPVLAPGVKKLPPPPPPVEPSEKARETSSPSPSNKALTIKGVKKDDGNTITIINLKEVGKSDADKLQEVRIKPATD